MIDNFICRDVFLSNVFANVCGGVIVICAISTFQLHNCGIAAYDIATSGGLVCCYTLAPTKLPLRYIKFYGLEPADALVVGFYYEYL